MKQPDSIVTPIQWSKAQSSNTYVELVSAKIHRDNVEIMERDVRLGEDKIQQLQAVLCERVVSTMWNDGKYRWCHGLECNDCCLAEHHAEVDSEEVFERRRELTINMFLDIADKIKIVEGDNDD